MYAIHVHAHMATCMHVHVHVGLDAHTDCKLTAGHWQFSKQISKVAAQNLDQLVLNCVDGPTKLMQRLGRGKTIMKDGQCTTVLS